MVDERVKLPRELNFDFLINSLNAAEPMSCVVLASSYIDDALGAMLRQHFTTGETTKNLLRPIGGQLGSFAVRASLAYCLGLISKGCKRNIETIGKIRNKFAHNAEAYGFESGEISELIDSLTLPKNNVLNIGNAAPGDSFVAPTLPRSRFTSVVSTIAMQITEKAHTLSHTTILRDMWDN